MRLVVDREDACWISKVRVQRKPRSASFCKPSPVQTVTACCACCIADALWIRAEGVRRSKHVQAAGEEVLGLWNCEKQNEGGVKGRSRGKAQQVCSTKDEK